MSYFCVVGKFGGEGYGHTLVGFDDVAVGYLDGGATCGWCDVDAVLFNLGVAIVGGSRRV